MINLCAQKLYLPFSIYVNDKGKRRIRIKNDKNRRDLCFEKFYSEYYLLESYCSIYYVTILRSVKILIFMNGVSWDGQNSFSNV